MAYDSTLEGSQTLFQCSPGFVPSQQRMTLCTSNGLWSPDPAGLVCRGILKLFCHENIYSNTRFPEKFKRKAITVVNGHFCLFDYTILVFESHS